MYDRYPIILDGAHPYDLRAHILDALRRPVVFSRIVRREYRSVSRAAMPHVPGVSWHAGKWHAKAGAKTKRFGSTAAAFWQAVAWKEQHDV